METEGKEGMVVVVEGVVVEEVMVEEVEEEAWVGHLPDHNNL